MRGRCRAAPQRSVEGSVGRLLGPGRKNRAEAVHRSTIPFLSLSLSLSLLVSRFRSDSKVRSVRVLTQSSLIINVQMRATKMDLLLFRSVCVCSPRSHVPVDQSNTVGGGVSEEAEFRESREAVQALSTARTHERAPRTTVTHTPHTASLRTGPIMWCPGGRRWGLLLLDMDSGVQYCKWLQSYLCIDVSGERQRRTQSRSEITCRGGPQTVIYLLPATRTMYTKSTDG